MARYTYRVLPGGRRAREGGAAAPAAVYEEPVLPSAQDGTAAEILEAVGDDAGAARMYLEAEQTRDKPRSTLIAKLEKVAAGA